MLGGIFAVVAISNPEVYNQLPFVLQQSFALVEEWAIMGGIVEWANIDVLSSTLPWILGGVYGLIALLLFIIATIYTLSLTVRRLRDLAHNPWWCLLSFVPIVSLGFLIYLSVKPKSQSHTQPSTDEDFKFSE